MSNPSIWEQEFNLSPPKKHGFYMSAVQVFTKHCGRKEKLLV